MAYRKFRANSLFTGSSMLGADQVLITTVEGKVEAIVPAEDAGDQVEFLNGILMPGLINCHLHLELSHLKNKIQQKTGLPDFILQVVRNRAADDAEIYKAIEEADAQMSAGGTVAAGDICNTADTIDTKKKSSIRYHSFIETFGWVPESAHSRYKEAADLLQQYHQQNLNASIVPHAPYSLSRELWDLIQSKFKNNIVSFHYQESADEIEFVQKGTGKIGKAFIDLGIPISPQQRLSFDYDEMLNRMREASSLLLIHNTFMNETELNRLMRSNLFSKTFLCICIRANLYIENKVPPIELFRKNGCRIVIGTDSLASNTSLSLADEIKTIHAHFPEIDSSELLQWATLNGAEALGISEQYGSFEKGKRPGIVLMQDDFSNARRVL